MKSLKLKTFQAHPTYTHTSTTTGSRHKANIRKIPTIMKTRIHLFHHPQILFSSIVLLALFNIPTTEHTDDAFFHYQRHLFSYNGDSLAIDPSFNFENARIMNAYIAMQAWKESITSDPRNITSNWYGCDVCSYNGIFCWAAPDNPSERTVAGIDFNHGDIAGNLPNELGLLYDVSFFHLNSNRFCGTIPQSFANLRLLYELDLSNNRFAGKFPEIILKLQGLRYLDIRFNEFEGELPKELFNNKKFDAIFANNNRFSSALPDNFGGSSVSVLVLANNQFGGCVPASLRDLGGTLNELILTNIGLSSCFPGEVSELKNLTVLDLSHNSMVDWLPESIGDMVNLEILNVAHNMMSGKISSRICSLPKLVDFAYDHNYFSDETRECLRLSKFYDQMNCFNQRPDQRLMTQCQAFLSQPVNCSSFHCNDASLTPNYPSPSPPSQLTPPPPLYSP